VPLAATAMARPSSPLASMASCGQAGTHNPHRTQASSTMRTVWSFTATASVGHTRTHARQATQACGSIEYIR